MTGGCSCPNAPRGQARTAAAAMRAAIRRLASSTPRLTANALPKAPRCRLDTPQDGSGLTRRRRGPAVPRPRTGLRSRPSGRVEAARAASRRIAVHRNYAATARRLLAPGTSASRAWGIVSRGWAPRCATLVQSGRRMRESAEARRRHDAGTAPLQLLPQDLTIKQLHVCRRARKHMVTQGLIACRKVLPPTKAAGLVDHSDGARSSSARASPNASIKPLRSTGKRGSS